MQPHQPIEERVGDLIREAEVAKGNLVEIQGRRFSNNNPNFDTNNQFVHSAMVDEDYLVMAAHIEEGLIRKIRAGEYVDFSKLLPRDRVHNQQDNRVELLNINGKLGCAPLVETQAIATFAKWEQAFRVFSDVYTREFPQRAADLIQYNHVIYTAAMSYVWNNVYAYDIDFCLHMARHPQRSWSVILQQAWNLRLRDRSNREDGGDRKSKKRDICWRYNRGRCTYGNKCKFDHRCGVCSKYGHGAGSCRRISGGGDHSSSNYSWDKKDFREKRGDEMRRKDRDHPKTPGKPN